jgi:glycosyltransferase involved in cell wall biosynthesis
MNILLINHYAGSPWHGMEFRPYYMGREWVKFGHKVRIVAASKSHIRSHTPEMLGKNRYDEVIDGIEYTWLATPNYQRNGIRRVFNMASFLSQLMFYAGVFSRSFKPDVVIASSTYPLDIFPAHYMARRCGAKLVFEVHDLWPLSPIELGGMSKWHPFIMLMQCAEDYFCRHSDVVISILPKVREHLEKRGLAPRKLRVVQNGISIDEWNKPAAIDSKIKNKLMAIKANGKSIVGYAGTHGLANALECLLEAGKSLQDEKVVFVFVGEGPSKLLLQQKAKDDGISNLMIFCDSVKKEQMPAVLKFFDVAYIGSNRQSLYRFGISPNKLMDYMMAGVPIINAIEAGNDPVAEAGCGMTVEPENPKEIAQGIRKLLSLTDIERNSMGERGREYILKNHTYDVLARQFLEALND